MGKAKAGELPFSLDPLDKLFVPPKPKNSVDDETIIALENAGRAIYTRKRDGHYISAVVLGDRARLYSRGEVKDLTKNFPHIEEELRSLHLPNGGALFCCEFIAEKGGSDHREFVARLVKASPKDAYDLQKQNKFARLMMFNLLIFGGQDVSGCSNAHRIGVVNQLLSRGLNHILPVETLFCSFKDAQNTVLQNQWEGLVIYDRYAKSAYRLDGNEDNPPRPVGCWKRKPVYEDDFIAYGWALGTKGGRHEKRMGKLFLAQVDPRTGNQIQCGEVGIGFSDKERERFASDRRFPCVVQIEFERRHEPRRISKGRIQCALCNPRFARMRDDKKPGGCLLPEELSSRLSLVSAS